MKPEPLDKELYDKIKQEIYNEYPKHSIYRSMMIVKRYRNAGGKYKDKRPITSSTQKWLNERWLSANDYLRNKVIQCGNSDTIEKYNEYPLCYAENRMKQFTKDELKTLIKEKNILGKKHLQTKEQTGKGINKIDDNNIMKCECGAKCGSGTSGYALHAVIIKRDVPIQEAKRISKNFIPDSKSYYRTTEESYRFRNIPKTMFDPKTYRTKVVNDNISLIYGKLKKDGSGIIDKAKSLYGKAKEKATMCRRNPVGCAFGFNYCGPFTKLEGQAPTNDVDKICLTHDYDYSRIDGMKKDSVDKSILEDEVRKADEKMLDALKYIPESQQKTMGYKLAKYGIYGKTQLEDIGLLPKTAFAGGSIHTIRNDDFDELQGEILRMKYPHLIPINKKYGGFIGQIIGQIVPQIFSKMASKGIEAIKKDPMKIVNMLSGGAIDLDRLKMFV